MIENLMMALMIDLSQPECKIFNEDTVSVVMENHNSGSNYISFGDSPDDADDANDVLGYFAFFQGNKRVIWVPAIIAYDHDYSESIFGAVRVGYLDLVAVCTATDGKIVKIPIFNKITVLNSPEDLTVIPVKYGE